MPGRTPRRPASPSSPSSTTRSTGPSDRLPGALLDFGRAALWAVRPVADDGVHVDELADAVAGQLAPVAGVLDPAEGQPGVGRGHAVDRGVPRPQPGGNRGAALQVAGPDVAAEPEAGVVGQLDGVIGVPG